MHDHNFRLEDWPFSCSIDEIAFSSQRVVHQGWPILVVSRDYDGDWQLLHGEIEEDDELATICLGCAYTSDVTLAEVASLKLGSIAERNEVGGEWSIEQLEAPSVLSRWLSSFLRFLGKLSGKTSSL